MPDHKITVAGQIQPRCDVGVMIEPGHDDLVAGTQLPAERAGQREVERGHVGAEDDFVECAAEEAGRGRSRLVDQRLKPPARCVGSSGVAARFPVYGGDGGGHLVGSLSAAGRIEKNEVALQRAEASTRGGDRR